MMLTVDKTEKRNWLRFVFLILAAWGCSDSVQLIGQEIPLPDELAQQQASQIQIVEKIIAPTVCVHSPDGNGGGSGVLISADGFAITNYHVVEPCGSYMQCTLSDGRLYDAVIVGIDPTGDVALIQLLGRDDFPIAEMADSDTAEVGETCFAVGNPFLLATNRQPTVTKGIISGTHRYQEPAGTLLEYTDCIQIDASVNPGNSGGPLFNHQGQLIGINGRCSFEKRGRINVGVAYAISLNQIQLFLGPLHSGRVVDHATLGASFVSEDGRVVLDRILENSDAAESGLLVGDELLEFGGVGIKTVNQFKNRLGIFPNRWYVPIKVKRERQELDFRIRLTDLHTTEELQQTALPFQPQPGLRNLELPDGHKQTTGTIPEIAGQRIEHRVGFVNHYFNRQQIVRMSKRLSDANAIEMPERLAWRGEDQNRGQLSLAVSANNAGFQSDLETRVDKWPEETIGNSATADPNSNLPSDASQIHSDRHLMLYGLMAWHRLQKAGLQGFPVAHYQGRYPSRRSDHLLHVVEVSFSDLNVEFFVDEQGKIQNLICTQFGQVSGCELYYSDWQEVAGTDRKVPSRFVADFQGETIFDFKATQVEGAKNAERGGDER